MSVWQNFLDNIAKPIGRGAQAFGESVVGGAQYIGEFAAKAISSPGQAIADIVLPAGVNIGTSKPLAELNLKEKAREGIRENIKYEVKGQALSNDLVLRASVALHDNVISPFMTRPVGTIGLLTDSDSPLYQSDKFEPGFQVQDIRRAYNRTEKVSLRQALIKSDLSSIKLFGNAISLQDIDKTALGVAGIDLEEIDLWNDADVQEAFVDNVVGRYYTGYGDFLISNAVIGAVGGRAALLSKLAARKVGFTTKARAAADMEAEIDAGIQAASGVGGFGSSLADDVLKMTNTDDLGQVYSIWKNYSNNENLIGPIARATNPETVRDLLLADKGYLPALERLSKNAPADLFEIGDVKAQIAAQNVKSVSPVQYSDEAWARMNAAFDDAIARVPEYRAIRDALLDPESKTPWMFAKEYAPMEPIIGGQVFRTARGKIQDFKAIATTRDFSKLGTIESVIIGNPKVASAVIRFTGTYKPLGYVTFSGSRPYDAITELNAFFDDIDMFANGANKITIAPGKQITAAEYRAQASAKLLSAQNQLERKAALEAIDDEMGLIMAYTNGFFDKAQIKDMVTTIRSAINGVMGSLGTKGYAFDHTGMRLITDGPQTQRQIVESYRFSPWNIIEKEFKARSKTGKLTDPFKQSAEEIKSLYETFNKWWTFEVLARPSYIPKQSLAEPILSATMAHGAKFVIDSAPSMTKNSLKNNKNRIMQVASRMYRGKELREVDEVITSISNQLDQANTMLDELIAEEQMFLKGEISPVARAENYEFVKNDIAAARRLVEDLELQMLDAAKPFGEMADVPTISNLERRLDFIEKNVTGTAKAKIAANIANAKSAIGEARGTISTMVPNAKELFEANKKVAAQYEEIDRILKDLGEAKYKQAQVWGRSAQYKERFYGKGYGSRMINGRYVRITSLFDEEFFGKAFLEEFANSRTASQTYLGDLHEGIRQNLIMRRSPQSVTRVNNPMYFEELAYLVNRAFRGDPLVDRVLAGEAYEEIFKWATSDPGLSYFSQFGTITKGMIPEILRQRVSMVYRYLPTEEARSLASRGEVRSIDLQLALARDLDKMHPIQPLDFNYPGLPDYNKVGGFGYFDRMLSRGAAAVFRELTRPENPIRWASADTFFYDAIQRKAQFLADQGLDVVGLDKINSLRSSARREALQQNEKTFYTINRNNRALYAARAAVAFPAATLNAFYRYGRFTINNPQRVASFLYNYQAAFRSFGIDQYGNPVDDPLKATHLVVPGTKEMGFFGGEGIRLNARSIGFLLNFPTPSIYTSQAVSGLLKLKPVEEDTLKEAMGPIYDIAFPYGPQESLGKALVPVWASDFYKYVRGPESSRDFLDSWNSVHNYYMALNDLGIKKYPGDKEIKRMAQDLYGLKARWSFASAFGVPAKVDIRPNQLFEDYYGILVNKYQQLGNEPQAAKQLAGEEFLKNMGEDFPLDQISFKGSQSNAYIAPTSKAWNRVLVNNKKLAEELVDLDPEMIGLLTLDLDYDKDDFNLSIYRKLQDPNMRLPGGELLNKASKTPAQIEKARLVNRAWNAYNTLRDKLEAVALADNTEWRDRQDLQELLKKTANTEIRQISEQWWEDWNDPQRGDKSFRYARGLYKIVTDENFMSRYGNTKLWDDVKEFLTIRSAAIFAREALPKYDDRKGDIRDNYQKYIELKSETWHPKLRELLKRNFEEDTLKAVD